MSYEIYITRKENWFDEEGEKITLSEWQKYVESSPDMRMDNYAETLLPDGTTLRTEGEGISVWTEYSEHDEDGTMAWFTYSDNGTIAVKNPDQEIRQRMYAVAQALNAKVQGEADEIYDENGDALADS